MSRLIFLSWMLAMSSWAQDGGILALGRADSLYALRAEHAQGQRAHLPLVQEFVDDYRVAMADSSLEKEAGAKYLRALYFLGCFADTSDAQRLATFTLAKEAGETLLVKYPSDPDIGYWWAVTLALWARETNPMTAIRAGVPSKMKAIGASIASKPVRHSPPGGADQILGRLHQLLPYIPVLLPWPDKALAEQHLRAAVAATPDDPNPLWFLADLLKDQKRFAEIRPQVDSAVARHPRPDQRLEDTRAQYKLRKLLME